MEEKKHSNRLTGATTWPERQICCLALLRLKQFGPFRPSLGQFLHLVPLGPSSFSIILSSQRERHLRGAHKNKIVRAQMVLGFQQKVVQGFLKRILVPTNIFQKNIIPNFFKWHTSPERMQYGFG